MTYFSERSPGTPDEAGEAEGGVEEAEGGVKEAEGDVKEVKELG